MLEVDQRTLATLEQHRMTARHGRVEQGAGVGRVSPQEVPVLCHPAQVPVEVLARKPEEREVLLELSGHGIHVLDVEDPDPHAGDLADVRWAYAAQRRADGARGPRAGDLDEPV